MRPAVSSEKPPCGQGRTMARAGCGKKSPFVTSIAQTSPEEKLFLVRREFFFFLSPFVFSCVVLTEKGNFGSDTQAVIYRLVSH